MNRTVFLIDGFNLYHSTREASKDLGGKPTKWLNIDALCRSYLYAISKDADLRGIYYFSALAKHLNAVDPGKVQRHEEFIECLEDTGVEVKLAKFKRKPDRFCARCGKRSRQYEEKETDVAIAAKLLELVYTDACDTVVLMTGDTDLAPAVKTAQSTPIKKDIRFALPYKRHNNELRKIAPDSFRIGKERYANYQFTDPYVLSSGKKMSKPPSW
jgi:uncharacterized LabA/DUF88 family protein